MRKIKADTIPPAGVIPTTGAGFKPPTNGALAQDLSGPGGQFGPPLSEQVKNIYAANKTIGEKMAEFYLRRTQINRNNENQIQNPPSKFLPSTPIQQLDPPNPNRFRTYSSLLNNIYYIIKKYNDQIITLFDIVINSLNNNDEKILLNLFIL